MQGIVQRSPVYRVGRIICYGLLWLVVSGMLAGCLMPAPSAVPTQPVETVTDLPPVNTPAFSPMPTVDPTLPVILLERPLNAGTLYLVRYRGAQGLCLCPTFNIQTCGLQRCGAFNGAGVGFVDTVIDPVGNPVRLAYGLALDATITAVAVEFSSGSNTPAQVFNGGYLLVLSGSENPHRATAINQYGYMVGQWAFAN